MTLSSTTNSAQIVGKTLRLTWTEGPTKGSTYEHVFHDDGTVAWRTLDDGPRQHVSSKAAGEGDRPRYLAKDITEQVVLVSYLSGSGYTLTVALNFRNQTTVGVASNETSWTPVEGTFLVEHPPATSIGNA
jgi:hypothetical protein